MFVRLAGIEIHFAHDTTKRTHGSRGAYRFEGGFEAWAFGRVLVVSRATNGCRWELEVGGVVLGAS